jgi:hypothetical protein
LGESVQNSREKNNLKKIQLEDQMHTKREQKLNISDLDITATYIFSAKDKKPNNFEN